MRVALEFLTFALKRAGMLSLLHANFHGSVLFQNLFTLWNADVCLPGRLSALFRQIIVARGIFLATFPNCQTAFRRYSGKEKGHRFHALRNNDETKSTPVEAGGNDGEQTMTKSKLVYILKTASGPTRWLAETMAQGAHQTHLECFAKPYESLPLAEHHAKSYGGKFGVEFRIEKATPDTFKGARFTLVDSLGVFSKFVTMELMGAATTPKLTENHNLARTYCSEMEALEEQGDIELALRCSLFAVPFLGDGKPAAEPNNTTEAEHTPGEWLQSGMKVSAKVGEWDVIIATANNSFGNGSANARLIAAAPELLDACEASLFWLEAEAKNPGTRPEAILETLRAIISKSKGSR